ncbi:MAG: hypothetical protein ABIH66_14530 [bacterium]
MTEKTSPTVPLALASLFARFGPIDAVMRIVLSEAEISALLTFRGDPEKKVLLDFSKRPVRVLLDDEARGGQIRVTADADIMHNILLGRMAPGVAVSRREMLLRGNASHLAKFIPLFEFGPLLYKEHLSDIGFEGHARGPGYAPLKEAVMSEKIFKGDPIPLTQLSIIERAIFKVIDVSAYVMGYVMGIMRYRILKKMSLFNALAALSNGLAAASPKKNEQ